MVGFVGFISFFWGAKCLGPTIMFSFHPSKKNPKRTRTSVKITSEIMSVICFVLMHFISSLFWGAKYCFTQVLIGQTNVWIPIRMVSFRLSKNKMKTKKWQVCVRNLITYFCDRQKELTFCNILQLECKWTVSTLLNLHPYNPLESFFQRVIWKRQLCFSQVWQNWEQSLIFSLLPCPANLCKKLVYAI